jgi:MYXO-CTERM domain-containing protein
VTTMQVNYNGNGLDTYYLTLDPNKASTGTQTITWGPSGLSGTFSTTLDLNLVIRKGGLNGKVVDSTNITLKGGDSWSDIAPKDAITITGVNQFLSGTKGDPTQDFWPSPPLQQMQPGGGFKDKLQDANPSPEPSGLVLGALGLVGVGGFSRRRRP